MEPHSRRIFLKLFGHSIAVAAGGSGFISCSLPEERDLSAPIADASEGILGDWRGVSYPVSLPTHDGNTDVPSFYEVRDTLEVPDGFVWDVVVAWGDTVGPTNRPDQQFRFGYNCDYTALIPKHGRKDEFFLFVNHEYISARPWTQGYHDVYGTPLPALRIERGAARHTRLSLALADGQMLYQDGNEIDLMHPHERSDVRAFEEAARVIGVAALNDMGISVLHVRLHKDGRVEVLTDSGEHKRISPYSSVNCRTEAERRVSGPSGAYLNTPRGTACNCSGAVTPWGTVLTCEENFQDITSEYISPSGESFPPERFSAEGTSEVLGIPIAWGGIGSAISPNLDGRDYGWVCEVDPETGSLVKHSALGRFRHENVTLCAQRNKRLRAYMGDDRRGGHVWRYESRVGVHDPSSPHTSNLLTDGILYVARFNDDYTGEWIPLLPSTPLRRPEPERCSSGHMMLPRRPEGGAVGVGVAHSEFAETSVDAYLESLERFCGKSFSSMTLRDLVVIPDGCGDPDRFVQHVLLLDAFLFGNIIGGTPSARPEDLEYDERSGGVFIAFTEAFSRREGSPDRRIFEERASESAGQYGAIFFLREGETSQRFVWSKLVRSGEVGDRGSGFACADNLAIDEQGDLWVVCDISTDALNRTVSRTGDTSPGQKGFLGIFGNNALFRLQRRGEGFGYPECFAIGPCECELTGPTFLPGGRGLVLSVQHPGEQFGTRVSSQADEHREFAILSPGGDVMHQVRKVPIGSNFPSLQLGAAPKPTVVCIRCWR
jgi:secreted PhoX family phosphatase